MKRTIKKVEIAKIANNTLYPLDAIEQLVVLGTTVSKWRGRTVTLYQHPANEDGVISVGVTFDKKLTVIADEPKTGWVTALDYAKHGKVYVSD